MALMGSNVQSQFFETRSVLVAGAIVNSVMAISWRVRKGASWSAFASFSVYRPVVLLPPCLRARRAAASLPPCLRARRAAAAFEATQVRWVWWWCELFVQALVGSHSQLFAADALLQEGDVQQPELSLSL